jgi:hypothetical protein
MAAATKDPTSRRPRSKAGIAPRRRVVQGTLHPGGRLAQAWRENRSMGRAGGRPLRGLGSQWRWLWENRGNIGRSAKNHTGRPQRRGMDAPLGCMALSMTRRKDRPRDAVGVLRPGGIQNPAAAVMLNGETSLPMIRNFGLLRHPTSGSAPVGYSRSSSEFRKRQKNLS